MGDQVMGDNEEKENLLFVCTYNKMRSKTGEEVYRHDERFEVKSGGIDSDAPVQVDDELLEWADYVVVMEDLHVNWIRYYYPDIAEEKPVICLKIPDAYYFMEAELVLLIKDRFEHKYRKLTG
jgi:predicted protein tyrosine phosphatase